MPTKQLETLHTTSCSILADRSVTALFVLVVLLSSFFIFSDSALAASTSEMTPQMPLSGFCSKPASNGHCYAEVYWNGHTGGSSTLINPFGAMNCQGCSTYGFITDETWFTDDISSQCINTSFHICWVESGVSTYAANEPKDCNPGHNSTCLFWADNRPNPGGYHEWPLYTFGGYGVDLTPYLIYVDIVNNDSFSSSGSNWDVVTNIYKNGQYLTGPSTESTNNNMNVYTIIIGSELSDSNGAAGPFYFQYNQWMDGSGNFNYQTTTGVNGSTNSPPNGSWAVNPCKCQGNTGGSYKTYD